MWVECHELYLQLLELLLPLQFLLPGLLYSGVNRGCRLLNGQAAANVKVTVQTAERAGNTLFDVLWLTVNFEDWCMW